MNWISDCFKVPQSGTDAIRSGGFAAATISAGFALVNVSQKVIDAVENAGQQSYSTSSSELLRKHKIGNRIIFSAMLATLFTLISFGAHRRSQLEDAELKNASAHKNRD